MHGCCLDEGWMIGECWTDDGMMDDGWMMYRQRLVGYTLTFMMDGMEWMIGGWMGDAWMLNG